MSELTLGRYLFERLKQLEVLTIFGLPGDFNLPILDKIYEVEGMKWAGNANELNAAYAADGYSRIKGLGCLVTTFGVGELSALNGIGGAFAEHIGLVHIVGVPSISSQAKQLLLHHTLGNGDFTVFHRMSNNISQTTTFLSDIRSAPEEIDRCLKEAKVYQKPVYIGLPVNLVDLYVPDSLLETPIDMSLPPNDPEDEEVVFEKIKELISLAENPIIILDGLVSRHNCEAEAVGLAKMTGFPVYTTPMAKGCANEGELQPISSANLLVGEVDKSISSDIDGSFSFCGVYVGSISHPKVKEAVDSADLILSLGVLLSEFNTSSFSYNYKTNNIVEFHADYVKVQHATYPGLQMKPTIAHLLARIGEVVPTPKLSRMPSFSFVNYPQHFAANITHEWLWERVSSWFREGDIIITDTGTSAFGIIQTRFPNNTIGISQVLWGSIGYSVGATLGAVMAATEIDPTKRVIVFVGDGSLQVAVQEISTMVKWGTTPYIFVLNNEGYTSERLRHKQNAGYNDIQPWNLLGILPLFNAPNYETIRITTVAEAESLFQDEAFGKNSKIRLIEVVLPRLDASSNLKMYAGLGLPT